MRTCDRSGSVATRLVGVGFGLLTAAALALGAPSGAAFAAVNGSVQGSSVAGGSLRFVGTPSSAGNTFACQWYRGPAADDAGTNCGAAAIPGDAPVGYRMYLSVTEYTSGGARVQEAEYNSYVAAAPTPTPTPSATSTPSVSPTTSPTPTNDPSQSPSPGTSTGDELGAGPMLVLGTLLVFAAGFVTIGTLR